MRLFDSQRDAERAREQLRRADFDSAAMEEVAVEKETNLYEGGTRGRLVETIVSGSAGGALAGLSVLHLPGQGLETAPLAMQQFVWVGPR